MGAYQRWLWQTDRAAVVLFESGEFAPSAIADLLGIGLTRVRRAIAAAAAGRGAGSEPAAGAGASGESGATFVAPRGA